LPFSFSSRADALDKNQQIRGTAGKSFQRFRGSPQEPHRVPTLPRPPASAICLQRQRPKRLARDKWPRTLNFLSHHPATKPHPLLETLPIRHRAKESPPRTGLRRGLPRCMKLNWLSLPAGCQSKLLDLLCSDHLPQILHRATATISLVARAAPAHPRHILDGLVKHAMLGYFAAYVPGLAWQHVGMPIAPCTHLEAAAHMEGVGGVHLV